MENQEMLNQLKKQTAYARIQCLFAVIAAVCCLVLLVKVWSFLPVLSNVAQQAQELTHQASIVAQQAESVMGDLQTVAEGLAEADLPGMAEDVNSLVSTSQTAVQNATEKLDAIDIQTMNQAIKDLADVVKPIADLFNGWGGR